MNMPNKELTKWEVEARLLYSIIVAGKSAAFADKAIARFLRSVGEDETPLQYVKELDRLDLLDEFLREAKVGNYAKVKQAFSEVAKANFDLSKVTPEELEDIYGIGPKTSRFFVMWTRPDERYAALDVHVLRWLREHGYDAPKTTPQNRGKYRKLEKIFIKEAEKRGISPRDLDWQIWSNYSKSAA